MGHPRDGELRRLVDEPSAVPVSVRRHAEGCSQCQERVASMRADAEAIRKSWGESAAANAAAARERLRLAEQGGRAPRAEAMPPRRVPYAKIAGWSAAAALVLAVGFTPVGSYAKGLLLIFQPKSFKAVPLTKADVSGLQNLRALGSVRGAAGLKLVPVENLAAAQAAANFHIAAAGAGLPAGLGTPSYGVMARHTTTLQLSAAKIASYAAQHHLSLPSLPQGLDGTTISVTTGPAVVTVYGGSLTGLSGLAVHQGSVSAGTSGGSSQPGQPGGIPQLLIAQAPSPSVYSTGATLQAIEQYFAAIPGISPQLAAEIKAIGDPAGTLPIPIPAGKVLSRNVTVQGVSGLAFGDQTGIGSAVVWQKGGMVYAVAGSLPESQMLEVAQGLH